MDKHKKPIKPLATGDKTIPPEGAKMIPIYIMGREYMVPETLTIMKATEYAGYQYMRGCGCRGGICGACGTFYRFLGDYKLKTGLACQTVAQPNINSRQYSDLEVPVPPLSIQDKFASLVERLAALKQRQRRTTKEMAQLFNSLMSRAFSGELVLDAPEITEPHQTSAKPPTLTDYMKT